MRTDLVILVSLLIRLPKRNSPLRLHPPEISKIGMIGLGAMGQGMVSSLLRAGFRVHAFDVYGPAVDKFISQQGNAHRAASPAEAAKERMCWC